MRTMTMICVVTSWLTGTWICFSTIPKLHSGYITVGVTCLEAAIFGLVYVLVFSKDSSPS
jgi:hypothetical protein